MADVLVKPAFQSAAVDSGDVTKLGPTAWNAARLFSAGNEGEVVVRRAASATGAAWEVPATVAAAAGTLTGATLAANVLASSLTSLGTLSSLAVSGAASSFTRDALAAVSTDGVVLQNTTAATAGVAVQQAPRLRLRGNVWNTTTPATNTNDWWMEVGLTSGATPIGVLKFATSLNGGAASVPLQISSQTGGISTGTVTIPAAGNINFTRGFLIPGSGGGQLNLTDASAVVGVGLDFATDATLKIRTRAQTGDASLTALDGTFSGNVSAGAGSMTTGSNYHFNSKGRLTATADGVFSFLDSSSVAGSVSASKVLVGDGTLAAPSFAFTSAPGVGLFLTSGALTSVSASVARSLTNASGIQLGSGGRYGWASTADASGAGADTGISRVSAGVVGIGTGAVGSVAGSVDAAGYKTAGVAGVATFGPAAVVSITVKGGIITAIS